jgi:hypothetical protein
MERFNRIADLIDADKRILLCRLEQPNESEKILVCDLPSFLSRLEQQS